MPTYILVADDDPVFGEAMTTFLDQQGYVTEWVQDAAGVMASMGRARWDVLVSDISMPGNESLELLDALRGSRYPLPVIVVTGNPTLQSAITSLRRDAVDYLTKPLDFGALASAVHRAVERSRTVQAVSRAREQLDEWSHTLKALSEALVPHVSDDDGPTAPLAADPLAALTEDQRDNLSPREREVLVALASGSSTRDLAEKLFISEHTVRNHLKAIYRKLGVHSRTELFSTLTAWGKRS
jgi:two-component system nitrate/nitrite response regulator NarL